MECQLCVQAVRSDAILNHLYNQCHVAEYWWQQLNFPRPMCLEEMLAPEDTSFDNSKRLNHFVKTVRLTYWIRQNLSRDANIPLTSPTEVDLRRYLNRVRPMGR